MIGEPDPYDPPMDAPARLADSLTDAERELVEACTPLRDLRAEVAEREPAALARRDLALAAWWSPQVSPKKRAGEAVKDVLRRAGWSEHDVELVGVSSPSVRVVLDRARHAEATR